MTNLRRVFGHGAVLRKEVLFKVVRGQGEVDRESAAPQFIVETAAQFVTVAAPAKFFLHPRARGVLRVLHRREADDLFLVFEQRHNRLAREEGHIAEPHRELAQLPGFFRRGDSNFH